MDYEAPFLIDNPDKIITHLSILLKNKCLLTVCFGDNGDSFITTIMEIDKQDNVFIFHHGPKEDLIEQLLTSPQITFKTVCLGVEVVFDTQRLLKIQHQGLPAFAVPAPASLLWMERREFYRVKLPAAKPSYCQLALPDQGTINLKLYDISLGGFSMLSQAKKAFDLSNTLDPMALYTAFEQCKLVLEGSGEGVVSFEIRSKHVTNPASLARVEKVGCKFTHLPPVFENVIQRHMQQIERENRQKQ